MDRLHLSRPRGTAVAVVLALIVGVPLVLAAPAQAATGYALGATFTAGHYSAAVAADSSTDTVYVTDLTDNVVRALDGDTGAVQATIAVGSQPLGVAVDPGAHRAYVSNTGDESVSVIDTSTDTVVTTVSVDGTPYGAAVDPSTHRVYVTLNSSGRLDVLDGSTDTVVASTGLGSHPEGVAVDPSTHVVYAANRFDDTISVVDGSTLAVLATLPTGDQPEFVAADPTTHRAYVTSSDTMTVVDGTTRTVVDNVVAAVSPYGVAVDPSTHTVYVADAQGPAMAVVVVDGTTDAVIGRVTTPPQPFGVAVDPSTHRAYVTSITSRVYRIDSGPLPGVTAVSPSSGLPTGGESVTVSGTGLTGATAVSFGGTPATSFTVDSATQITAVAPAHALGTVDVTVTTAFGTSTVSAADRFSYGQLQQPTLSTTPSAGTTAGGTVSESATLTGGIAPSGTIHFDLYGPADPTCAGPAVAGSDVPATLGSASSTPVTVTTAGTYHWSVHYGGDTLNAPADATCVDATSVTAGPLTHLATVGGDAQTVVEGHRFGPLQVLATDTYGNPVTTRTAVRYTVTSGPAAFPRSTGTLAYTTGDGSAATRQLVAGVTPGHVDIRAAAHTPDGHLLTTVFTGTVVPTPWTGPATDGIADTRPGAAQGYHLGLLTGHGDRNTWRLSVTQPAGAPVTIYTGTVTVDAGTLTAVSGKQLEPGDTISLGTDAAGHSTATFLFHDYGYLDELLFTTPDTATTLTLTLSIGNRPATAAQLFLGRTGAHPADGSPLIITRQTP